MIYLIKNQNKKNNKLKITKFKNLHNRKTIISKLKIRINKFKNKS